MQIQSFANPISISSDFDTYIVIVNLITTIEYFVIDSTKRWA